MIWVHDGCKPLLRRLRRQLEVYGGGTCVAVDDDDEGRLLNVSIGLQGSRMRAVGPLVRRQRRRRVVGGATRRRRGPRHGHAALPESAHQRGGHFRGEWTHSWP